MSRIEKRLWTEDKFGILGSGGFFDLVDNSIKAGLRIDDDQYDWLIGRITDEEYNIIMTEKPTFTEKRAIINLLNKYLYK